MCFWGEAYALGPNINAPMAPEAVPLAWTALQKATERSAGSSPAERAWIAALAVRYAQEPGADRGALDAAFAQAMADLADRYPEDDDALPQRTTWRARSTSGRDGTRRAWKHSGPARSSKTR